MKPDRKLCTAIVALRPSPAFEQVVQAIREDATEALRVCGSAEGNALLRAQGKYQALNQWLEAFDEARDLLDRPNLK